jgi:tetratricopeptide (TPR) repeat protein
MHLPADDGDVLDARVAWAGWLLSRNEIAGAQAQFQQIIDHAKDSHLYYAALANGGLALAALKRHDVAGALDRSAIALKIIDTFVDLHDERFRPYLWNIRAQALLVAGDSDAAAKWAHRAVEADRRFDDPNSGALKEAQQTLLLAQRDPLKP